MKVCSRDFERPQPPSPNLTVPAVPNRGLACVADAPAGKYALHREKHRRQGTSKGRHKNGFFPCDFELPQPPSPNLTVPAVPNRGLVCVADAPAGKYALHREETQTAGNKQRETQK